MGCTSLHCSFFWNADASVRQRDASRLQMSATVTEVGCGRWFMRSCTVPMVDSAKSFSNWDTFANAATRFPSLN